MTRSAACTLAVLLTLGPEATLGQAAAPQDPEVVKGIKLVDDGDLDGAILTLDNAARRLTGDPAKAKDLSQAYLYLGIAYVGKGHEAAAKAKFREALGQIKGLTLSPDRFSPKVIDVFEAARQESARPVAAAAPPPAKKGGHGKAVLIGVGVLAAGGGVAAAAGGGGGGDKTPADTRKVETFTGTLCGDESVCPNGRGYDIVVGATGQLDATVTWTDGNVFFEMSLDDENFNTIAHSNRTSNTSAAITGAAVRPQTSSSSSAYHLFVGRGDSGGAVAFNLTVKHP